MQKISSAGLLSCAIIENPNGGVRQNWL
jgi:hypothetical protein